MLLTVSPFYHYNRANYDSSPSDPVATTDHRGSSYAGGQVSFSASVKRNDLQKAKELQERIRPTADVFYSEPWVDMHNRMKEALVLLGRLPRAVVRPPLVKLESAEIARIRQALIEAGLLDVKSGRHAA